MARIPRMVVKGEEVIYHIISRTALDGFVLGDVEKEHLLKLIKWLSSVYFTEVFGFCIMGNHFHMLAKMKNSDNHSDEEVWEKLKLYYQDEKREIFDGQIPYFREKLSDLSEYIKEIKQRFSRYYNKLHGRKGYFWGERFKSVIVEEGDTLINCLAYIDLNPIRANIVRKPEDYRWSSLGYHIQSGNKDRFLSTDFGVKGYGDLSEDERLRLYREFVYEKGALMTEKGKAIEEPLLRDERQKDYTLSSVDRLRYRTRYFTDSGIIGSKGFVSLYYSQFKNFFNSKRDKKPKKIAGFNEMYSLKFLNEKI